METSGYTIVDRLTSHALQHPDKTVFIFPDNGDRVEIRITYGELASKVKRLACQLAGKGLEKGRVILVYEDTQEFIISFLACQYAGIIPVPVSPVKGNKHFSKVIHIFMDAQAAAVLCADYSVTSLKKGLSGFLTPAKIDVIATNNNRRADEYEPVIAPDPDSISFIQYTSGSTAKPKGVVITAGNLIHNQQLISNTFNCNERSVIFSWLPFHHDMGLIGNILHTIYVGCTCVIIPPLRFMQKPVRWLEGISKYKATHSGGPNFSFDLCTEKCSPEEIRRLDLSNWIVAYNGSEPVRPDTIQRFRDCFKSAGFSGDAIRPCYGLAEATLLVSGQKGSLPPLRISIDKSGNDRKMILLRPAAGPDIHTVISSGKVVPGMEVRIISPDNRQECGELEEGEICITGKSVMSGYWNRENKDFFYELDGRSFLRTGDLGFLYNGELFIHSRLKEMLIIRGQNFYPGDIENLVTECHQAIETNGVAVFAIDGPGEDFVIVAEIKRTFLKDIDTRNVISTIERSVSGSFGIPPYDIILTTPLGIPRTTSGKLQRIKCKSFYHSRLFTVIGPTLLTFGKTEKRTTNDLLLAEVIRTGKYNDIQAYLLDLIDSRTGSRLEGPITADSGLTAMGIDSLKGMELINTINRDLSINIDAVKNFQDNTLSGLITTIENHLWLKNISVSGKEITI